MQLTGCSTAAVIGLYAEPLKLGDIGDVIADIRLDGGNMRYPDLLLVRCNGIERWYSDAIQLADTNADASSSSSSSSESSSSSSSSSSGSGEKKPPFDPTAPAPTAPAAPENRAPVAQVELTPVSLDVPAQVALTSVISDTGVASAYPAVVALASASETPAAAAQAERSAASSDAASGKGAATSVSSDAPSQPARGAQTSIDACVQDQQRPKDPKSRIKELNQVIRCLNAEVLAANRQLAAKPYAAYAIRKPLVLKSQEATALAVAKQREVETLQRVLETLQREAGPRQARQKVVAR